MLYCPASPPLSHDYANYAQFSSRSQERCSKTLHGVKQKSSRRKGKTLIERQDNFKSRGCSSSDGSEKRDMFDIEDHAFVNTTGIKGLQSQMETLRQQTFSPQAHA